MKTQTIMTLAALALTVSSSFAAETTTVSKDDRIKMATMHTKMAACLQSDKPMGDCQSEMMKSCKEMMGKSGCPMMGMGMGPMKGMMKGKGMMMMDREEEDKSDKKSED